jgi:hypothetical protein
MKVNVSPLEIHQYKFDKVKLLLRIGKAYDDFVEGRSDSEDCKRVMNNAYVKMMALVENVLDDQEGKPNV